MPFPSMFKRKGTSSKFAVESKTPQGPPSQERPKEEPKSDTAKDGDIAEQEQIDEVVKAQNERDTKADRKEATSDTKGKGTVKDNEAKTTSKTNTVAKSEGAFSLFWDNLLQHNLRPVTYTRTATFIPNAMAMFKILRAAGPIVGRSKFISKHYPTYNEYAVVTGYAIVYYLQILRAKQAASNLDGVESNLLTRFTKMHPEESIPIASPLFPYFNTIVSTELEDRRFDWISPDYAIEGQDFGFQHLSSFHPAQGDMNRFVQPLVPHMIALLAGFGSHTEVSLNARINSAGVYTPYDLNATTTLFGNAVNFTTDDAATRRRASILTSQGLDYPFRFFNQNQNDARQRLAETDFYSRKGVNFKEGGQAGFRHGTMNFATANTLGTAPDFRNIDGFLNMPKTKQLKWFDYIKEQMAIHASVFSGKYNLSQVSTTGGLESSVIGMLRMDEEVDATNHRHVFADTDLNNTAITDYEWYADKFDSMTAHFYTSRAGIERNEELQAFAFATNSDPPIHGIAPGTFRAGDYFSQTTADIAIARTQVHGDPTSFGPGPVDMFSGWNTAVIAKLFNDGKN
nr:capsid protein [Sarcosphaera coronaria partitivirus]